MSVSCQKQTCHTSITLIHHDAVALATPPPSLWATYAAGKQVRDDANETMAFRVKRRHRQG
jgi:hypothetical protein